MSSLVPLRKCQACQDGMKKPFPFSMAFQPIVDVEVRQIIAYEALVRGAQGESAFSVLSQVTEENRYAFDQHCRVVAITLAAQLGLPETQARLSINFMPGAVYSPAACIQRTLEAARSCDFPIDRLIFEITEGEAILELSHLRGIVDEYRKLGFKVALDDFGAGYSGLNLLADLPVDHLKLDIGLIRNLPERPRALIIVKAIVAMASELGQNIVAEGVETVDEYLAARDCGIRLMQGYLFAKPGFEQLPEVTWPDSRPNRLFVADLAA